MVIVGLFAQGPNPAACVVVDGALIGFAEEERFSRVKGAPGCWPVAALGYCLREAGLLLRDVDCIAIGWGAEKYRLRDGSSYMKVRYDELSERYAKDPVTLASERRILERYRPEAVEREFWAAVRDAGMTLEGALPRVRFVEHHLAHAASSFFASGNDRAAVLVLDGSGEEMCTSVWRGAGTKLDLVATADLPDSLGWYYAAFTELLGYQAYRDEGKVMALAAYGRRTERFEALVGRVCLEDATAPLGYAVDPRYTFFGGHVKGSRYTDRLWEEAGGGRDLDDADRRDLAWSVQNRLEARTVELVARWSHRLNLRNVCLAGGVCLNCKANGSVSSLIGSGEVESLFIQPVSNDAGAALGSALWVAATLGDDPRFTMRTTALGPAFTNDSIRRTLAHHDLEYRPVEAATVAADLLAKGKVVGWFQGRMEVGPRALGHRSILADPRQVASRQSVNDRIKKRESWRPFGPAVLKDRFADYFDGEGSAEFMIRAFAARASTQERAPAVVHIDGSVRPQAVDATAEPLFAEVLDRFGHATGLPMLLNTSFNTNNEPIVCTPDDAAEAYKKSTIDALIIGDFLVERQGCSPSRP